MYKSENNSRSELTSRYAAAPTYTTKHGTRISPIVPAQYRGDGKAKYRLCQILPPKPQRLEWIHVYNILVHTDGKTTQFEQETAPAPKQVT